MRALFLTGRRMAVCALEEEMIYLDNSATTRPYPQVTEAVRNAMETDFGNPSTLYTLGLSAEKLVRSARKSVAKSLGADEKEVYFTSGGTESDNAAIFGAWGSRKKQGRRIITTAVEHPAVLKCFEALKAEGADVVILPVDPDCAVSLDDLRGALTEDTVLVSVMRVNNETGAIFPVPQIAQILGSFAKEKGIAKPLLHSDCVQSYGKMRTDVSALGVDMLSISGHKIHGPKGIGALYVRKGVHIPSFIYGGGQENGLRSGTENVPGIAGLGVAAELITPGPFEVSHYLKDLITDSIPDIKVNSPESCCSSVLNISFLGCRAEVLLHQLEQDGIYVSTGSACSSKDKGSHVLSAMGLKPEEMEGALRFSFNRGNTKEEMEITAEKLRKYVESQRKLRSAFRKR